MNAHRKYNSLKHILVLGTVTAFFLAYPRIALACTPAPRSLYIEANVEEDLLNQQSTCLDKSCLFVLEKTGYGGYSINRTDEDVISSWENIGSIDNKGTRIWLYSDIFYNDTYPLNEPAFLESLDTLLEEDIADIKAIFFQDVKAWLEYDKGVFLSGNLVFAPYDSLSESELISTKNQLLSCRYAEYKRVGDWLISEWTSREYCYSDNGSGAIGMCPLTVLSYPKFFVFLLSDIDMASAPYLAVFTVMILIGVLFVVYLVKRRELWFFLKPRKVKVTLTTLISILMLCSFWYGILAMEYLLWIIGLVYLIGSFFDYIGLRHKNQQAIRETP